MSVGLDRPPHLRLRPHRHLNPVNTVAIRTPSGRRIVRIHQIQNALAITNTRSLAAVINRLVNMLASYHLHRSLVRQDIFEAATNCNHFHHVLIRIAYLSLLRLYPIQRPASFLATTGILRILPVVDPQLSEIAVLDQTGVVISLRDATAAWDCSAAAFAIVVSPSRTNATNTVEITTDLTASVLGAMCVAARRFSWISTAMGLP